jgi:hypothetical protein
MSLTTLYLISILPGLGYLLARFSCILVFAAMVSLAIGSIEDGMGIESKYKALWLTNMKKWGFATIVCSGLLAVLIPSEKQLYFIAGGYAATNITGIDKLPENVVKAANDWLEGVNKEGKK